MDNHKPLLHTVNCECGNKMTYFKWDRDNLQSIHACTKCDKIAVVKEYKNQEDECTS